MLFSGWLSFALNRLRLIETHSYMLRSVRLERVRCADASRQDAAHPNTNSCSVYGDADVQGRYRAWTVLQVVAYNASLQLATVSYPISHAKFCS